MSNPQEQRRKEKVKFEQKQQNRSKNRPPEDDGKNWKLGYFVKSVREKKK